MKGKQEDAGITLKGARWGGEIPRDRGGGVFRFRTQVWKLNLGGPTTGEIKLVAQKILRNNVQRAADRRKRI